MDIEAETKEIQRINRRFYRISTYANRTNNALLLVKAINEHRTRRREMKATDGKATE